ncbi:hypothetical protein GCM10023322_57610 [Rugosimonospora acidiphila]|uniref:Uncharacterized protein n=1 Tax=Rugosimonospora acidiphila TaxID=556531 RepID=A0ABP9SC90_9ACTN
MSSPIDDPCSGLSSAAFGSAAIVTRPYSPWIDRAPGLAGRGTEVRITLTRFSQRRGVAPGGSPPFTIRNRSPIGKGRSPPLVSYPVGSVGSWTGIR